jgi:hypothetical protein
MFAVCASLTFGGLLDWAVYDWSGGSLSNTYNVDGVNVTLTFTGDTSRILNSHSSTPGPLPTDLHSWDAQGLWWAANFNQLGQSLTLTITFDQVVSDVAFSIHDLDGSGGNWEQVTVSGSALGSAVNPAITAGAKHILTGTTIASNNYDQTPADVATTAMIQFASADTIVLLYESNINAERGEILSNITFIPEPATLLLLGAGAVGLLRRSKK